MSQHSTASQPIKQPMSKRQRTSGNMGFTKKSKSMFKPKRKSGVKKTQISRRSSLTPTQQTKLLGVEHKYCDYYYVQTAVVRSANSTGLTLVPNSSSEGGTANAIIGSLKKGDDSYQRDGRQVYVDEILIKGWVKFAGAEAVVDPPEGSIVSILLFQDTETNKALAASENVVTNPAGFGYSGPNFLRNPNGYTRFNSISAITVACPPRPITQFAANNYSAGSISVPFEIYKKFKTPIQIRYGDTNNGDYTDIIDNSFQILATEGGDAPTIFYGATITFNARMRFYG